MWQVHSTASELKKEKIPNWFIYLKTDNSKFVKTFIIILQCAKNWIDQFRLDMLQYDKSLHT